MLDRALRNYGQCSVGEGRSSKSRITHQATDCHASRVTTHVGRTGYSSRQFPVKPVRPDQSGDVVCHRVISLICIWLPCIHVRHLARRGVARCRRSWLHFVPLRSRNNLVRRARKCRDAPPLLGRVCFTRVFNLACLVAHFRSAGYMTASRTKDD